MPHTLLFSHHPEDRDTGGLDVADVGDPDAPMLFVLSQGGALVGRREVIRLVFALLQWLGRTRNPQPG